MNPEDELTKALKALEEIGGMLPRSQGIFDPPWFGDFAGLKVYEAPPEPPKIQLREDVMVTDEFRKMMNTWLLERFGRYDRIFKPGTFYLMGNKVIADRGTLGILTACTA